MSGGHFDYYDSRLKDEIYGYAGKPVNVFEDMEISELVWDVLNLIHDYDWYASGDTGKETYLKAKLNFKKKWMDNRGVRVKRIVDEAIQSTKNELYETFNLKEEQHEYPMKDKRKNTYELIRILCEHCGADYSEANDVADMLIAHGVTFKEEQNENLTSNRSEI